MIGDSKLVGVWMVLLLLSRSRISAFWVFLLPIKYIIYLIIKSEYLDFSLFMLYNNNNKKCQEIMQGSSSIFWTFLAFYERINICWIQFEYNISGMTQIPKYLNPDGAPKRIAYKLVHCYAVIQDQYFWPVKIYLVFRN